jgi:hypothetical protein
MAIISISLVVQCSDFCFADSIFGIQYLLQLWVVVHACHLVDITNLVDHYGLLVQIGALVELQWELQ